MVFLFSFVVAGSYVVSNPVLTNNLGLPYISSNNFYNSQCTAGQDFILQVAPQGCTPTVVRSDLLESQSVPVFCPIVATKVNPLININSIESISFSGGYPSGVQDIGFQQNYAAIGNLNSKALQDAPWAKIGYATIVLSKTQENQLKNCHNSLGGLAGEVCWIEGNLTAKLNYDLDSGMGVRSQTYFLPMLSDTDFNDRLNQYSFFDNNGFVRATSITPTSATIGVYSGLLAHPYTPGADKNKQRVGQYTLKIGQSSPNLYLPGFQCLSSVNVKLNSITYTDTVAQIEANSAVYQLRVGQNFLDKKCTISKIDYTQNYGINQQVQIHCNTDDDKNSDFSLFIQPKVELRVNGVLGDYSVGDAVTNITSEDGINNTVYLAYASNLGTPQNPNLKVYFIALNGTSGPKLSSKELALASNLANDYNSPTLFSSFVSGISNALNNWKGLVGGKQFVLATSNKAATIEAKNGGTATISVVGFGDGNNIELSSDTQKYYSSAISNYTRVTDSYRSEKYSTNPVPLGEQAYFNEIKLANDLGQKHDVQFYCKKLFTYYPNSTIAEHYCSDSNIANSAISSKDVLINGVLYKLNFDGVIQPSIKDYSGTFVITNLNSKTTHQITLGKNEIYYIPNGNGDSIQLTGLGESSAGVSVTISQTSNYDVSSTFSNTHSATLKLNKPQTFSGRYSVALTKVNLARVANVVVTPTVRDTGSRANFSFRVAVEKRAVSLSPEKAKSLASKTNKTINALQSISKSLGTVVNTMQDACLATGTILTLKNLVTNSGSEIQARKAVMEGWKSKCQEEMTGSNPKFTNLDACYYNHTKEIDNQVNNLTNALEKQSKGLAKIKADLTKKNNDKSPSIEQIKSEYAKKIATELSKVDSNEVSIDGKPPILVSSINNLLEGSSALEKEAYSMQELQNLEKNLYLYKSNPKIYSNQFYSSLDTIKENGQRIQEITSIANSAGINPNKVAVLPNPNGKIINIAYSGSTLEDLIKSDKTEEFFKDFPSNRGFKENTPILIANYNNQQVVVFLKSFFGKGYTIMKNSSTGNFEIYTLEGRLFNLSPEDKKVFGSYRISENPATSVGYQIINPKVRYYETGSNPLPAIVPFDSKNGWYAYMPQSTSSTPGVLQSYDSSGKLESFEICRVGSSGIIDPKSDSCSLQILSNGNYGVITGLNSNEAKKLVDEAIAAVAAVSKAHTAGIRQVKLNLNGHSQTLDVGAPLAANTGITCAEVMSPKDCQILFNVCDPVICPPSRCNYGGEYNVQDVIQSGIIGSIMLCLPNAKEGIKVPVCLSGIKAGLDGLTSTLKSYRDCLITNSNTGQNVGICDEMNSVYMCQFLWKQALPLTKIGISKLIVAFKGGSRGGGEYSSIQSAFNNAKKSINYFTSKYATSNFKFLKTGSQGTAGANICDNFISFAYPSGQGILNALGTTESPPQYTANFQEIPMTTATNPPTSQYNVYYNIYSGKNQGAYFQVYLQGSKSYYQDSTSGRLVASGYIGPDNYSTQKIEFTAPSGYTRLCIQVNGQEKCGFKEVSTSFAKNYLADQYIKKQSTKTNIHTTAQCVSGTVSSYTLLNLNLQNGIDNTVNPSISKYGIIRTCSTDNPGIGTDTNIGTKDQRWVSVGTCGDSSMQCWLDTQSVKNAVNFQRTAKQVLNKTENSTTQKDTVENFLKSNGYLDTNINSILKIILTVTKPGTKEALVNSLKLDNDSLIAKMFYNSNKGKLFLVRGDILANLTKIYFKEQPTNSKKDSEIINPAISLVNGAVPIKYSPLTIQDVVNDPNYNSYVFKIEKLRFDNGPIYYIFNKSKWYWSNKTHEPYNCVPVSNTVRTKYVLSQTASNLNRELSSENYLEGLNTILKFNLPVSVPESRGLGGSFEGKGVFGVREFSSNIFHVGTVPSYSLTYPEHEIYFRQSEGYWLWNIENSNQLHNWAKLKESEVMGEPTTWDRIKHFFSSSRLRLMGKISKIPKEVQPLMADMIPIDSNGSLTSSEKFKLGAALIFSNETTWKQVGQLHATGDFTPTTVINYLSYLNESYNKYNSKKSKKQKELIVNITKAFVRDLIKKGYLPDSSDKYFSGDVPNYDLIKSGLNPFISTNKIISQLPPIFLSCKEYIPEIEFAADKYGVDPNLIWAIMYQESQCKPNSNSDSSNGLMQINAKIWKGKYGLSTDISKAKSQLSNPLTNINVGTQILKSYYNQYGSSGVNFNGCAVKKSYSGWEAALRAYNGLGCNTKYPSQDYYVENVEKLYSQILSFGLFPNSNPVLKVVPVSASSSSSSSKQTSCPLIQPASYLTGTENARQKVLEVVNHLNNQPVPSEANVGNCWDSVFYIYHLAGVTNLCEYSDTSSKVYQVSYGDYEGGVHSVRAQIGTSPYLAATHPSQSCTINKESKVSNLDQSKKLSSISPGDILSLVWQDSVHNVIFLNWVNSPSDGLAKIFTWYCPNYDSKNHQCKDGIHKYEEIEVNISDDQYPVYQFWSPVDKNA